MAPEGATLKESHKNLDRRARALQSEMQRTGVKLLWGTANLFSQPPLHRAAPPPTPIRKCSPTPPRRCARCSTSTHRLGGENYVLWGGREGYETLLNTDMKRRSISSVASSRWWPSTSTRSASRACCSSSRSRKSRPSTSTTTTPRRCTPSCRRYGLEKEYKVNIEANHAILAGHSLPARGRLRDTPTTSSAAST